MINLVWFKRDLRIRDHKPLYLASKKGPVLPLYIVDPDMWDQPDVSGRHWEFLKESLIELREELTLLGQPLIVRVGPADEVIKKITKTFPISAVWSHQETGNKWSFQRDKKVDQSLKKLCIPWYQSQQHGVIRGSVDRNLWAKNWETLMRQDICVIDRLQPIGELDVGKIPDWPNSNLAIDFCPKRQKGGIRRAHENLESFLTSRSKNYLNDLK